MARKHKHTFTSTRTHVPSTPPPKGTLPAGVPGPAPPPSPPATPSVTTTTGSRTYTSGTSWNPKIGNPVGGSASVVLVLVVILLLIAEWNNVVKPLAAIVWGSGTTNAATSATTTTSASIAWKNALGLIIFGAIIVFIASINDDAAGLMMIVVLGMLAVYMIENKGGAVSALFGWLNPGTLQSATNNAVSGANTAINPTVPAPTKTGSNP